MATDSHGAAHRGHPRRSGARPHHRRRHAAGLLHLHLPPARRGHRDGLTTTHAPSTSTARALERALAALEGGLDARCFASGMSAIQAVLPAASSRATTWWSRATSSGEPIASSRACTGSSASTSPGWTPLTWRPCGGLQEDTRLPLRRDPANPTLSVTDLRAWPAWPTRGAPAWWWTTPSSPDAADADLRWARTW